MRLTSPQRPSLASRTAASSQSMARRAAVDVSHWCWFPWFFVSARDVPSQACSSFRVCDFETANAWRAVDPCSRRHRRFGYSLAQAVSSRGGHRERAHAQPRSPTQPRPGEKPGESFSECSMPVEGSRQSGSTPVWLRPKTPRDFFHGIAESAAEPQSPP